MAQFKTGDIVKLKSGGPVMTVESYGGEIAGCSWFDGKSHRTETFRADSLVPAEEPKPPRRHIKSR